MSSLNQLLLTSHCCYFNPLRPDTIDHRHRCTTRLLMSSLRENPRKMSTWPTLRPLTPWPVTCPRRSLKRTRDWPLTNRDCPSNHRPPFTLYSPRNHQNCLTLLFIIFNLHNPTSHHQWHPASPQLAFCPFCSHELSIQLHLHSQILTTEQLLNHTLPSLEFILQFTPSINSTRGHKVTLAHSNPNPLVTTPCHRLLFDNQVHHRQTSHDQLLSNCPVHHTQDQIHPTLHLLHYTSILSVHPIHFRLIDHQFRTLLPLSAVTVANKCRCLQIRKD